MYGYYFDQESPIINIKGMIADLDVSPAYEIEACAVFKAQKGYLVVFISGCSCWPERGHTEQTICPRIVDVDRKLRGRWSELLDKCQARNWKVDERYSNE